MITRKVQVFAQEGPLEGPVLGKVFLSQLYLFVNYENSTFSLAQQNPGQAFLDVKSSGACPSAPALTQTDKGLITVGAILGVLIFGIVFYVIRRWSKKPRDRHGPETELIQRPVRPKGPEIRPTPRPSLEER
ncbi:Uncharacterized protein HZ326_29108 [Fusarium oxysporum f. sp. albedinis]|nr:Uncharacterized protein HZ326_29108 [Fusarium oxysporum f. sp. albedinis]